MFSSTLQVTSAALRPAPSNPRSSTRDTLDDALIERVAADDPAALKVLYARHHVRIYRFVLRLIDDKSLAEEVTNEVFLEVWKSAAQFEGRSQVATWLLGIARHKALAQRRRRSAAPLDEQAYELIEDTSDTPEQAIQRKQDRAILLKCLIKLSPAHREIVDLVYYHGKAISEVADIVGIELNTVKTRMFYARKHLRELLAAQGVVAAAA